MTIRERILAILITALVFLAAVALAPVYGQGQRVTRFQRPTETAERYTRYVRPTPTPERSTRFVRVTVTPEDGGQGNSSGKATRRGR